MSELLADAHLRLDELEREEVRPEARFAASTLLENGRLPQAWELLPDLLKEDPDGRCVAARIYEVHADWPALGGLLESLVGEAPEHPTVRRWIDRWNLLREDYASVDQALRARRDRGEESDIDRILQGRLFLQLHRLDAARDSYLSVVARHKEPRNEGDEPEIGLISAAYQGLAGIALRRLEFDAALNTLRKALPLTPLDPEMLTLSAHLLIRLGRTSEAMDVAELVVRLRPWHEGAHSLLGNGYSRRTYTQLAEEFSAEVLEDVRERVASGARLYADGEIDAARWEFAAALHLCPAYGRAHNGLARTLEALRSKILIHVPSTKAAFLGVLPELERFVVNWADLPTSRRDQIRRSVTPWIPWLPILAEAGASCYLKPLDEKLSQAPGHGPLKDLRIEYDARLWDDVRGCGGFHMVTGIEDLERASCGGADTLLHELTHQVHQILPRSVCRRIEALFQDAKQRQEQGEDAFICRYAGENEWEYFAENLCASQSPRRDEWDAREVVRERLEARDPEFLLFLEDLLQRGVEGSSRAMAAVRRGEEHLRHHRLDEALSDHHLAFTLAPEEPSTAAAWVLTLQIRAHRRARETAEEMARRFPESGRIAVLAASARLAAGFSPAAVGRRLQVAREAVQVEERGEVDLAASMYARIAGDAGAAVEAAERVLRRQADHPEALLAKARALGLARSWQHAFTAYDAAVRRRPGSVPARTAWARDLFRAEQVRAAAEQLAAARLLDAQDPDVRALGVLESLQEGRFEEALERSEEALPALSWHDPTLLARARVLVALGREEEAERVLEPLRERVEKGSTPVWRDRDGRGNWFLVRTLPTTVREEFQEILSMKKPRNKSGKRG